MADRTNFQLTVPRQLTDDRPIAEQAARANACCGGPALQGTNACCARDAEARSTGGAGCGCGSTPATTPTKKTGCCG